MGSIGPNSSHTTPRSKVTSTDIDAIKALLSSTSAALFTPQDAGYDATIKRWSMAASKPAGLSVQPTSAHEVSLVVRYAAEHNLDIAVKGGGHSTAGVSSTDGGVLLDMEKMRGVRYDSEKKVLVVQGGANWGDVDQEGFKHGVATVGGTVADTGVGGLTLGGGYGWLSGQYGLTIDVLVEAEIVLASGEVVRCSEEQNRELFWAVRGAGQNFGVATEFVLRAFETGKEVWAGMMVFPPVPEVVQKVVAAINGLYEIKDGKTKVDGKGSGGLGFAKPPDAGGNTVMLVPIIYFGTEAEGKNVYKELYDIGPVADTMAMVDYPKINTLLAPPYGLRASMKGAAFEMPIRGDFVVHCLEEYNKFMDTDKDLAVSMLLWELFDPRKVDELRAGSFANRGTHMNGMICPIWTNPENDQKARLWAREMNEKFKKELEEYGGKETGDTNEVASLVGAKKKATQFYGNYDHYDERSRDIFGDNYAELQKLKAQYDPGNVFNKLFAITPA
jgi:FAD/FMN-containing dehydrogenase